MALKKKRVAASNGAAGSDVHAICVTVPPLECIYPCPLAYPVLVEARGCDGFCGVWYVVSDHGSDYGLSRDKNAERGDTADVWVTKRRCSVISG